MAWQNPHQPGWTPDGYPVTGHSGVGMPMPMPMPMPVTSQPGMSMPQPGIGLAPHEVPLAPPGMPNAPPASSMGPPTSPMAHHMTPAVPTGGWPTPNMNCPPGLEYLMALDQLFIDQKVELFEAFTGWETENRYVVKDLRGEPVFFVAEESNVCGRMCCGKNRPCDLKIVDRSMKEAIRLSRPLRCSSCWCPCFLQELEVVSSGIVIGSVVQNWNPFRPSFAICNSAGDTVLQVKGPLCLCSCYDIDFEVKSADGEHKVGRISKKWSGFSREVFTDADMFGISFPRDLDVKIKAVLIGACFLIDFMYFEGKSKVQVLTT